MITDEEYEELKHKYDATVNEGSRIMKTVIEEASRTMRAQFNTELQEVIDDVNSRRDLLIDKIDKQFIALKEKDEYEFILHDIDKAHYKIVNSVTEHFKLGFMK